MRAPDFSLPTVDGKQISLQDALNRGPVLLAFFKVSCPVCQYAFPFLERIFQSNRSGNLTMLGVSQDTAKKAKAFMQEFGVSFPVAVDDESNSYAVSNAYGLTNVPTAFLIAPSGDIEVSSVGWSKRDVETINQRLAEYRNQPAPPIWRSDENIQEFRPG
jgi:cytochrome c biogenesis protein CcmG/thiol:disulfide interchange protein DsbE